MTPIEKFLVTVDECETKLRDLKDSSPSFQETYWEVYAKLKQAIEDVARQIPAEKRAQLYSVFEQYKHFETERTEAELAENVVPVLAIFRNTFDDR